MSGRSEPKNSEVSAQGNGREGRQKQTGATGESPVRQSLSREHPSSFAGFSPGIAGRPCLGDLGVRRGRNSSMAYDAPETVSKCVDGAVSLLLSRRNTLRTRPLETIRSDAVPDSSSGLPISPPIRHASQHRIPHRRLVSRWDAAKRPDKRGEACRCEAMLTVHQTSQRHGRPEDTPQA